MPGADPLQSLLTWSIENTDTSGQRRSTAPRAAIHPSDAENNDGPEVQLATSSAGPEPTPKPRSDLNSEILDHIMGRSDAVIMREKLNLGADEEQDVNERIFALDDFEMLIESIDNANNIQSMEMWPIVLSLLESPQDAIIRHACWISGTAIQNNMKAQEAFFAQNPIPKVLSLISSVHPTTSSVKISSQTRAKAVYCLSAALKHWQEAVPLLSADSNRGWVVLREGLRDPEPTIRRKVAFLLGTLIMQSNEGENKEENTKQTIEALKENQIVDTLLISLTNPLPTGPDGDDEPDWDLQEKSFRALLGAAEKDGLDQQQKSSLRQVLERWSKSEGGWDEAGLSDSEAKHALTVLST